MFLDSDFSSTKKINQDKKFFKNEKPFTASSCERKIERLYDRFMKERNKRFELESKVNSSIKEIDSVKIKLQFLEENYSNCKCAPKIIPSTNKSK